nr:MFS transporter [Deinobacterium chartae]
MLYGSTFVTNIGHGAHTLAVSLLLYELTGSALMFGAVLSSEFIIALALQLFAGPLVDRGDPRRVMLFADFSRGAVIMACFAWLMLWPSAVPLLVSVVYLNLLKPFYRAANFALVPALVDDAALTRVNSLTGSFSQAGQLLGVALAGLVATLWGAEGAFLLDGLSFLLAAACLLGVRGARAERKVSNTASAWQALLEDWGEVAGLLRRQPGVAFHLLLASGDFLAVALINLTLVPLNQAHGGTPLHLSLLDGAFAVGSLIGALLAPGLLQRLSVTHAGLLGLAAQAAAFALLAAYAGPLPGSVVMFALGLANALSLTVFMSHLQRRSRGPIKGRIGSLRQMTLSLLGALVLPGVGWVLGRWGVESALLAAAGLMALYLVLLAVLSTRALFGPGLLTEPVRSQAPLPRGAAQA